MAAYVRWWNVSWEPIWPCIVQNGKIIWQGDEIKGESSFSIRLSDKDKGPGEHFNQDTIGAGFNVGLQERPGRPRHILVW